MLPPGHIAGGYIAAKLVLGSLHYNLSAHENNLLTAWFVFFSFAPDLDFFAAFFKTKSLRIENDKVSHRNFFTHAPLVWLAVGLLVYFLSMSPFYKAFGLIIWWGSWTHFVLDSEWGIMWLWPFSTRLCPFSKKFYEKKFTTGEPIKAQGFWEYWYKFAKTNYFRGNGYIEFILILIALLLARITK